jgi:hypothetical protein
MIYAMRYAGIRLTDFLVKSFAVIGVILSLVLTMPTLEIKLAPPVAAWQIVDARRVGDNLHWYVFVDKRRDCWSSVKWIGRWTDEIAPLRAVWWDGMTADGSNVRLAPGQKGKFGPFMAPVPFPWRDGTGIRIDADVSYNCGTPWALPPVPVNEATAR